ncbi:hypothetical protein ACZ87_03745 [Candidatus Erwinia dacicola]|uniref:Uncharacterized protein n=1 Tax=Candidatus Erwinia dacicola TaxID=252393 RepID=A0A328TFV2_9GAMM|nr:hypothetical protein ACZ87_03745 [Candidatus Erwinia dacicola]
MRHASQNESPFSIKIRLCFINLEVPQGDNGDFATLLNLRAKKKKDKVHSLGTLYFSTIRLSCPEYVVKAILKQSGFPDAHA